MREGYSTSAIIVLTAGLVTALVAGDARAHLMLEAEQFVESGGVDIDVSGYSVPSTSDWDNDGRPDLIVGEGAATGMVRVYLNEGSASGPQFSSYSYVQSMGSDLTVVGGGCLGIFPRVTYWGSDDRKDLLVGLSDGRVMLFSNTATDENPAFDAGAFLQVGPAESKVEIDVGYRACPNAVDWDSDGRKDLVVGAYDGLVHVFINTGTDETPDFESETYAQEGESDLSVVSGRSSPHVQDLDNDGRKDLLAGNTNGEIIFYSNTGTDVSPAFSGSQFVEAGGVKIDLAATPRSRPFLCDWNADGQKDLLVGAGDGLVRLYIGIDHEAGVEAEEPLASARLVPPAPNPAGATPLVAFELPERATVSLRVFDVSGRTVAVLADGEFPAGRHEVAWPRGGARDLSSGVYFVMLSTPQGRQTEKLVLVR